MTADLLQLLERDFNTSGLVELPGLGPRPLLTPTTEQELCEALRFGLRDRKRVLPIGLASKLNWMPELERVDFVLSTRKLAGIVAYEPGDGTLTAWTGTRMQVLEREVATGRHHLTPQVAGAREATLGGVLAAGQSGVDRAVLGPPRHHVLGMRVALADGRVVSSGGRLVKNVTGFDMHRLYAGSFGSLCVILEASLRLFPAHDCSFVIRQDCANLGEAYSLASKVASSDLTPHAVAFATTETKSVEFTVRITGRRETSEWLLQQFKELLPSARVLDQDEASAQASRLREADLIGTDWSDLQLTCMPSKLPGVLELIQSELPEAQLHVRPAVAELLVRVHGASSAHHLTAQFASLGARAHWRGKAANESATQSDASSTTSRMMTKIRSQLDPSAVFAGELPHFATRIPSVR